MQGMQSSLEVERSNEGDTANGISCTINADLNLMSNGADHCTDLNSDEDPNLVEEPKDEPEDAGEDEWGGDWHIGQLSDEEPDVDPVEIPDSLWSSAAKDAAFIKSMLSSGGSRTTGTVMQRIHGEMQELPAPELVRDYHRRMGVDVHDQLRMQRKVNNKSPVKHFAFMEDLMEQLLAVDSTEAFGVILEAATARERTAASPAQARSVSSAQVGHLDNEHRLEENPDTVDDSEEGGKKHHRTCKVCAFYKIKPSKFTKYFCPGCSKGDRR
ncbi:Hypothetical protein PHPALM_5971 [Phytophthora palmivora]|uniref:PiggyBac transposable element-derived protein domain-containing protein n=1 Tax=Phytophthora palmivora TaxID=4796 RepID=A0A2P4YG37_9STRA|nr:Hypothetical protein PHPALM_5971 [Phytophthora palmivora]